MSVRKRYDGTLLRDLPSFRVINPFVMRGRNESAVYFSQTIEVEETRRFLKRINAERPVEEHYTLFHIFLSAAVRTIALRPQLNRFVSGQRIYQRNRIQISFMVKKEMNDDGLETNAKISYSPYDTLEDVRRRTMEEIEAAKDPEGNFSDHEVDFFARLPRFAVNLVVKGFRLLDYFGIAPKGMLAIDPLYTSLYAANLGSLGLEPVYHHLYEWGNASLFMVIGKVKRVALPDERGRVESRLIVEFKYTLDDRISEGIYTAKALRLFKEFVQNPAPLLEAPELSAGQLAELRLLEGEAALRR